MDVATYVERPLRGRERRLHNANMLVYKVDEQALAFLCYLPQPDGAFIWLGPDGIDGRVDNPQMEPWIPHITPESVALTVEMLARFHVFVETTPFPVVEAFAVHETARVHLYVLRSIPQLPEPPEGWAAFARNFLP